MASRYYASGTHDRQAAADKPINVSPCDNEGNLALHSLKALGGSDTGRVKIRQVCALAD